MRARDPKDKRYPERLSASYLLSLFLHAVVAALLFTVASSSSQEGAAQDTAGGEVVTVSHVVAATHPVPVHSAQPPVPSVQRIAPVHHAPMVLAASQPQPPRHRELSHIVNTPATPLPRPVPQATVQPNPVPTQAVVEPLPTPDLPSVPVPVPTALTVAVTIKMPPTAAPSPEPTAVPTIAPTAKPQPSIAPTHAPETPKPAPSVAPKPAPTAVAVARATAAPSTPAPPAPRASLAPAKVAGVPSPSPTNGPAIAKAAGTLATPGPKGTSSPGPHAGTSITNHPGPPRPVVVTPTASPAPSTSNSNVGKGRNLLANMLGSLIPNNPTATTTKSYDVGYKAVPTTLDPTPPPDVLAHTISMYQTSGGRHGGTEKATKMWVTSIRKEGGVTFCTGWLVRYPQPAAMSTMPLTAGAGQINGAPQHYTLSPGESGYKPIIEPNVTYVCEARFLTPLAPSPAP